MTTRTRFAGLMAFAAAFSLAVWPTAAQGPGGQRPGGPGPGPGGMGPAQSERPVVAQFDKDGDKRLNAAERSDARTWLETQPGMGPGGRGGRGGPGGMGRGGMQPGTPGPALTPAQVKTYGPEPFYDPTVLRTFFIQFENEDWEKELTAFNNTDVEVPATLTIDGKVYKNVGVHTRGASSFFGVPEGLKRSLNVALDFVDEKQSVQGYRTLNLLNAHEDPAFLRSVLYLQAAREYGPAPKANFARVVINGESWGIYTNAQQYNKELVNEWFKTTDGARWKVPGSPNGRGGLEYLGDDLAPYKRIYSIKTKDDAKSWAALVALCKTLNTTAPEQLEKALAPMLDVDGALKFLALEVTLVNNDGYWTRASDYSIYMDPKGMFHVFAHDANETFPGGGRGMMMGPGGPPPPGDPGRGMPPDMQGRGGPGPGGRGGPGMGGPTLDPLIGLNDAAKPLRSKLLAVPALRARYMTYVRQIATKWLDWNTLGPLVQKYQALIANDVKTDTRKLVPTEAFTSSADGLKMFAERRREFLLSYKPQ
jgi:hypothetical protein